MSKAVASSGNMLADRRYAYALALRDEKDFEGACDLLGQTAELVPEWAPVWFQLGECLMANGEHGEARKAFEKALAADGNDTLGARLHLTRMKCVDPGTAMSKAYIASLFDQYAERFDDHLVRSLQYRGPEIICEALKEVCSRQGQTFHFRHAIDLGCGTGLMAALLRDGVDTFQGADLSQAMAEQARKTGLYNNVFCEDVVLHLQRQKATSIDLLTAADVLVYISTLEPLFQEAARVLASEGLFAFTVQSHKGDGYILGHDMRYHHSEAYLRDVSSKAGLTVQICKPCVTRLDAGKPVPGLVVVLSRSENSHG